MKKTKKLLAGAVAVAIGGLAMTGMASADTTVTHNPDAGITYTLNAGYPTAQEFTAGTITISDGTTTITMLDRNLGATAAGTGCEDFYREGICSVNDSTYGYHFQWGNNYGFDPNKTPAMSDTQVSEGNLIYDPSNQQYFSGSTLIIRNKNWINNNITDLRGGTTGDYNSSYPLSESDAAKRRGPCPENFHVPSYGELNQVMNMFSDDVLKMHNELLIPFAESRSDDGSVEDFFGYNAFLWTSSPYYSTYDHFNASDYSSFGLYFASDGETNYNSMFRTATISVRCFYDSYETYTPASSNEYIVQIEETMTTTIGETVQQGLPTPTITTNTVNEVAGDSVLGEVNVDFGSNQTATFSHPVQVNIPVNEYEQVYVKVKHGGDSEYGFAGLTTNSSVNCSNGVPISNQYNGETINVVDGYATIYSCAASSFIALGVNEGGEGVEGHSTAQINLSVLKGTLTIGTTTGNLNLGEVNVSNSAQELSGSFGENSFWVEDMKGLETGYYTTISVTDLNGTVVGHSISASNVYLKTAGNEPTYISGAIVSDSKVVFSEAIKLGHNGSTPVYYFHRLNTAASDAGRVGKRGDNLQIKVTIPAHTPYDTYRGTITYTLYDLDS